MITCTILWLMKLNHDLGSVYFVCVTVSLACVPVTTGSFQSANVSSRHRLQLFRNLRGSPGFLTLVPGPGRPYGLSRK